MRFYVFEEISNPATFVDECKRAFALNTAVFRELGEAFPLSAWPGPR